MNGRAQFSRAEASTIHRCVLVLVLLGLLQVRPVSAQLATNDPVSFFTHLSSRLLLSELGVTLDQVQIYPTNQYTPAVHRLLQVTANLWESTVDSPAGLPTVFRPRFQVTDGSVYLSSYVLVTNDSQLDGLPLLDLTTGPEVSALITPDGDALIFGVPLVIGARKGLPNFNEFSMDSIFQLTRKLQLVRSSVGGPITQTNQFFVMALTAPLAVEFWNSYSNDFTRSVNILVTNHLSVRMTNDVGVNLTQTFQIGGAFSTNNWRHFRFSETTSFLVPLRTNLPVVPLVGYLPNEGINGFVSATNASLYDTSQNLIMPRWGVTLTTRIHGKIVDQETGQLIGHVLLGDMISHRNLTEEISSSPGGSANPFDLVWATNALVTGELSGWSGVIYQIGISLGGAGFPPDAWWDYGTFTPSNPVEAIDAFRQFYFGNTNAKAIVPFSPIIQFSVPMIWQVNDPLVHQLASELFDADRSGQVWRIVPPAHPLLNSPANIGHLNQRYRPWTVEPYPEQPEASNLAVKDPLVRASYDWDFPINSPVSLAMLGRVHRGTPWQTIYLKSPDVDLPRWQNWTGHDNPEVAEQTHPRRDWSLVTTLQSLLNTNAPQQLLSVNDPNPTNWMVVFDGLVVLTNTGPTNISARPQFESLTITSNSPQAILLAEAIAATRANQAGQVFRTVADLLATSELTVASPWLNPSTISQYLRGMTDVAYEKIPSQLLSLIRADSIGAIRTTGPTMQIQFTGFDGFPYRIEGSTNLLNWIPVSTNYPTNGVFEITVPGTTSADAFYRSALLP